MVQTWAIVESARGEFKTETQYLRCHHLSKLLYGLETIHLTQAMSKTLEAVQMHQLRSILKRKSTFIDKNNINNWIIAETSSIAFPSRGDRRKNIFQWVSHAKTEETSWTHPSLRQQQPTETSILGSRFRTENRLRHQAGWETSSKLVASYKKLCLKKC